MNRVILAVKIAILLLALLASVGCGISAEALRATMLTEVVATREVAFKTIHGQYITAEQGEGDDGWDLGQQPELDESGWFTQQSLANGKIALVSYYDRYVTARKDGDDREDRLLGQESELSDCGQFDLYELGSGRVALKTCAGHFVTPGDASWSGLEWKVVGGNGLSGRLGGI